MFDQLPLERIVLTLLHFVWQGLIIALAAGAMMTLARRASTRYAIGCTALAMMIIAPMLTFARLEVQRSTSAAIVAPAASRVINRVALPIRPSIAAVPRDLTIKSPATNVASSPTLLDHDRLARIGVALWLIGVVALSVRHALGLAGVARLRHKATPIVRHLLLDRLMTISRELRIRRRVVLLMTHDLAAPAVVGWLRPAILWPASLMTGLSPAQLDGLLAHELAHIRRHDYFVNLLQTVIETLGFYHPAVWWLSRRVRQEREHCCDDIAAAFVGNRTTYAATLAELEALCGHPALAQAARGGSLVKRVERLLSPRRGHTRGGLLPIIVIISAVVVGLLVWISVTSTMNSSDYASTTKPTTSPTTNPSTANDYRITGGDLLRVTINDLEGAGVKTVLIKRVANSGGIHLPYFKMPFMLAGQTEAEARATIVEAYAKAKVVRDAIVDVLVIEGSDGSRVPVELLAPASAASQSTDEIDKLRREIAELTAQVRTTTRNTDAGDQPVVPDAVRFEEERLLSRFRTERAQVRAGIAEMPAGTSDEAEPLRTMRIRLAALEKRIATAEQQIATRTGEPVIRPRTYYVSGAVPFIGSFSMLPDEMSFRNTLRAAGAPAIKYDLKVIRRSADGTKDEVIADVVDLAADTGGNGIVQPDDVLLVKVVPATEPSTMPATQP